ncbi:MAG TPA: hypothetical protein VMR59_02405 [Patescibacteria group bacterium]|nr:hypothetical protein [Patescibacteria group bacterium]
MDDLAALTHQLEYLFLKKLIAGLKDKSLDALTAKEYANAFLRIEPFESAEDAYIKIMDFVAKNVLFNELKAQMNTYQSEKNDLAKINKMRAYIKQRDIDSALKVAKE